MAPPHTTPGDGDAAPRGATNIAAAVVEKIAERAAREIRGVDTATPSALRRFVPFASGGTTDANVGHERASVEIAIALRYPEPVWQKADEIRRHVTERIQAMTGLDVARVDVDVSQIVPAATRDRRRVI
jgi:uncharacterized alkaline shock family protein YloU